MPAFDWNKTCSYDAEQKNRFHREARSRLKKLAQAMGFPEGSYDLRSNKGGIAVSGEVTLHHDKIYVQASQSALGRDTGLLVRTCDGRKDYHGGPNNLMPLRALDELDSLVARIKKIQPAFETRTIEQIDADEARVAMAR